MGWLKKSDCHDAEQRECRVDILNRTQRALALPEAEQLRRGYVRQK